MDSWRKEDKASSCLENGTSRDTVEAWHAKLCQKRWQAVKQCSEKSTWAFLFVLRYDICMQRKKTTFYVNVPRVLSLDSVSSYVTSSLHIGFLVYRMGLKLYLPDNVIVRTKWANIWRKHLDHCLYYISISSCRDYQNISDEFTL